MGFVFEMATSDIRVSVCSLAIYAPLVSPCLCVSEIEIPFLCNAGKLEGIQNSSQPFPGLNLKLVITL